MWFVRCIFVTALNFYFICKCGSVIEDGRLYIDEVRSHGRLRRNAPGGTGNPLDRSKCKENIHPGNEVKTTKRLELLRKSMTNNVYLENRGPLDAYIIPSGDAHQSEYPSDHDKRRQYISGFSGSQGTAIVTIDKAALWTDGRYFLQAEQELDCNWILVKGLPTIPEWLNQAFGAGAKIGFDPTLLGWKTWNNFNDHLKSNIKLIAISKNLIDIDWKLPERPVEPNGPLFIMPEDLTGESWLNKTEAVRDKMAKVAVDALVLTDLTDIAWLFNLRGEDVPYNPVFISYTIIERNRMRLYLKHKQTKLADINLRKHLGSVKTDGICAPATASKCVEVIDYDRALSDIDQLESSSQIKKIWVSPSSSYAIMNSVEKQNRYDKKTPVALMKAVKNQVERAGMKNAHIKDAIALIQFLQILESEVKDGKYWTEISAANELERFRRAIPSNRGLSFESISSSGSNGAVIHYSPTNVTDKQITTKEVYLLDSGGQYLNGTTDVTRTFHFGEPTDWQKEAYTRVLMGTIDLARAVWPKGIYGNELDVLARTALWSVGLDYNHGTGHGIGAFLSVHEGPIWIGSGYASSQESPLLEGMFLSDEPGYYEDGKFGIRLETILMVAKLDSEPNFGRNKFLQWEPITLVPFEPNLIKYSLLSNAQRKWLNMYNEKCISEVGSILKLQGHNEAYKWLTDRTKKIPEISAYNNSPPCEHRTYLMATIISLLISLTLQF